MKLEYDIHFYNPAEKNAEESSSNRDISARDASLSPFLLGNNKPNKKIIEKEELTKKLKKLTEVVNDHVLKNFMIQCLILDFATILLFTYELMEATMEIGQYTSSFLYLIRYIVSMRNGILCLDFLIVQDEYNNKQKQIEFENKNKKKVKFPPPADSAQNVYLNPPNSVLRTINLWKFWMWLFKYAIYIIFMIIKETVIFLNYISIFLLIIEYYQYNYCRFYYYTMLRSEFIRSRIDLIEINM